MTSVFYEDKAYLWDFLEKPLFSSFEVPAGVHNSIVFGVLLLLGILFFKKCSFFMKHYFKVMKILPEQGAFCLEGAGSFSKDFGTLFPTHFNQIVRKKGVLLPIIIPQINVMVAVNPESFKASFLPDGKLQISFSLDAVTTCAVQLFWGVRSSCLNELLKSRSQENNTPPMETQDESSPVTCSRSVCNFLYSRRFLYPKRTRRPLLEMESMAFSPMDALPFQLFPSDFIGKSSEYTFQPGMDIKFQQRVEDQIKKTELLDILIRETHYIAVEETEEGVQSSGAINASVEWSIPLVVVATTAQGFRRRAGTPIPGFVHEANVQISLIKMEVEKDAIATSAVQQIILPAGNLECYEAFDVYGLESEFEKDCLICMEKPKDTMLFPCRHCMSCLECLRSLRQERCPICRTEFTGFVTFPFKKGEAASLENSPIPSSLVPPSTSSSSPH